LWPLLTLRPSPVSFSFFNPMGYQRKFGPHSLFPGFSELILLSPPPHFNFRTFAVMGSRVHHFRHPPLFSLAYSDLYPPLRPSLLPHALEIPLFLISALPLSIPKHAKKVSVVILNRLFLSVFFLVLLLLPIPFYLFPLPSLVSDVTSRRWAPSTVLPSPSFIILLLIVLLSSSFHAAKRSDSSLRGGLRNVVCSSPSSSAKRSLDLIPGVSVVLAKGRKFFFFPLFC